MRLNLTDPEAKATWRAFSKRFSLVLEEAPTAVRKEILDDLTLHVTETMARQDAELGEVERLNHALERLGDPAQFAAPLLGAQTKTSSKDGILRRSVKLGVSVLCVALGGFLVFFGVLSLIYSQSVGVFHLEADHFQIRLMVGSTEGARFLFPWIGLASLAIGAGLSWGGWNRFREAFPRGSFDSGERGG